MLETIYEQRPVRQPGERIAERLMAELLLEDLAFGDVPGGDHHAPHGRVVEQVVCDVLEVAPGAVPVGCSELQGRVKPGYFQDVGKRVQRSHSIFRMDGVKRVGPYLLFRLVVRDPLDLGPLFSRARD
jgi:hypothetical protein